MQNPEAVHRAGAMNDRLARPTLVSVQINEEEETTAPTSHPRLSTVNEIRGDDPEPQHIPCPTAVVWMAHPFRALVIPRK